MKKKLITLVTLVLLLFHMAGCAVDIDGKHKGLSIGFTYTGPRYSPIMYAVKNDKREFDIDEIILDFYCGWFAELPLSQPPYSVKGNDYIVGIAFYIALSTVDKWIAPQDSYTDIDGQHFMLMIPIEDFWSESFLAKQTKKSGKTFNHSGESITIPKQMFNQQEGVLKIYVQRVSFSYEDNLFHFDADYSINYSLGILFSRINDKAVRLSRL